MAKKFNTTVFYADKEVERSSNLDAAAVNRKLHAYEIKTFSVEEIEAIKEQKTIKFKNGAGVDSKIVIKVVKTEGENEV